MTSMSLCLWQVAKGQQSMQSTALFWFSGTNTASSCNRLTCRVPELRTGSYHYCDLGSASDLFTADSLQYVSTQPALVVIQNLQHAYGTPTCMLTHFALTILYVHTNPDSLLSFAEECNFGN